jgi:hypothetical protein
MVAYFTLKIPRIFNTFVYNSRRWDADNNVVIYNSWGRRSLALAWITES